MPDLAPSLEKEKGHLTNVPWAGFAEDANEEVPELRWPNSVRMFERMMNDAQVAQILNALALPVRQPEGKRWCVDPRAARDEIVTLIAEDLGLPIKGQDPQPIRRSRDRFSWDEHLRIVLMSPGYGFMGFEQVYRIVDGKARLRKLAPRMPDTIRDIVVAADGGLAGITQDALPGQKGNVPNNLGNVLGLGSFITGFGRVWLPVDRLVWYVYDQRPGSWTGRSLLRKAYKNWLLKDKLLRVDAIRHERNGAGVPTIEVPAETPKQAVEQLSALAQSFRAGEVAGGVIPGGKLRLVGVEGSVSDVLASIRYHDEQIAGILLTQFLKLGQTQTGSRALGESFIDFFDRILGSVQTWIADVATQHIVEDLVDLNWGDDEPAPAIALEDVEQPTPDVQPPGPGRVLVPPRTVPQQTATPAAAGRPRANEVHAARRKLFDHEVAAATNFEVVQTVWQSAADRIVAAWEDVRAAQLDELMPRLASLVDTGDLAALVELSALPGGYELLSAEMAGLADQAAAEAVAEAARQGVTIAAPDLTEVVQVLSARADATDRLLARALGEVAGRQALNRAGGGLTGADVATQVRDHIESLGSGYLQDQLGGALTMAQNEARRTVFGSSGQPATYYASELLDSATCARCSEVDGREYGSLDASTVDYPTGGYGGCLGGPRCRGTVVAVFEEAAPSQPGQQAA